jgi:flavin-dependent dehydrogenase
LPSFDHKPVIIGGGLSGVAISHYLSRAGVAHVLFGARPTSRPRLGESIDPAGSVALLEFFPEYSKYYHLKRYVSVYSGGYAAICDFRRKASRSFGLRMLGFGAGDVFIHVDRIGFDLALFEATVAHPLCTHADLRVESMSYDDASERIQELRISDGSVVRPSYVFDATNHLRLVARSVGVPIQWLSELQRVVFCHYRKPDGGPGDCEVGGWRHCTSLLRLYRRWDGIDGFAWCIPLGGYASVGVSMDAGDQEPADEAVVELVADAYARRGLDVREHFPERSEVIAVRNRYFLHERAYGGNWLLAGPSLGQVWFPTSSGVGSALLAGAIAPRMLESPGRFGPAYEAYVRALLRSHVLFDQMIASDADQLTPRRIKKVAEQIVAENIKRVARLSIVHSGPAARVCGWLVRHLSYPPLANAGWRVYETDLPAQTASIYESS